MKRVFLSFSRYLLFFSFLLFIFTVVCKSTTINFSEKNVDELTNKIIIKYSLRENDGIFADSLNFSVDNSEIEIPSIEKSASAVPIYAPSFKSDRNAYVRDGSFKLIVKRKSRESSDSAKLYMHFMLKSRGIPEERTFTFSFEGISGNKEIKSEKAAIRQPRKRRLRSMVAGVSKKLGAFKSGVSKKIKGYKVFLSDLVKKTRSPYTLMIFIFFLGVIMSLTPCIYPMIPITLGILQATSHKTFLRNSFLALCYTIGIAMTFAIIGLLTASGTAKLGVLLGNPFFVLFLVIFLGYFALSMFGFYEIRIPKFMRASEERSVNGSFLSAFLFGAMSGTIASPCVSPGLILVLSIVAAFGSKLLGFIYLFMFGLGLGMPLFLMGTFSNSMKLLPKAGSWMVEVKKLFGFMLLAMCFYYLKVILPITLVLWVAGSVSLLFGFYNLFSTKTMDSRGASWFRNITGGVLLLTAILVMFEAYKLTVHGPQEEICIDGDYCAACERCTLENKLLLLDFGAEWCPLCKKLERKFLHKKVVWEKLAKVGIVRVDCTNPHAISCAYIIKRFNVTGFPTLILIKPDDQSVVARWGAELLYLTTQEFIELILKECEKAGYSSQPALSSSSSSSPNSSSA